ncbi:patatin-like phospholipase family protein [Georgenia sunbinii]|uniref:patatin-like phospholipase family protein n=1 Tax=Georgenia sunbinii TaxID=3117728 RepID=UPI002F266222
MPLDTAPDEPVVGLVLSGGGARSSFQIGALHYLYGEVGIAPSVITGTSAGSIIAAVLAQSADHDGQRALLDRLDTLFREMRSSSDMFTELPWFTRLRERGPVWMQALDRGPRRPRRPGPLGRSFRRVADLRHGITAAVDRAVDAGRNGESDRPSTSGRAAEPGGPDAADPTDAGTAPLAAEAPSDVALPTAPPTRTDARTARTGARPARTEEEREDAWPVKVLESIEILRTMGRASSDIEEIVEGAQRERSMFRPGPFVDRLVEPDIFDPAAVPASGVTLRIAVVALESGELRYVTQDGSFVDRENRPVEVDATVELVEAVRASCAIPMVFPPVRLGAENYVDGGVRESLPTEVAMKHLGVHTCYAVVAGPSSGVPREESFDDKDMLAIVLRTTTTIMTDEVQRDEVMRAREAGAVVIEPEFDVHDTLTVAPGLVAISIDYGYLRAAEVHQGASAEEQAITRDIIELRREIWRAEELAFGPEGPEHDEHGPDQVDEIADRKLELRDLLQRVPIGRTPAGAASWWQTWEAHAFDVPVDPGWVTAADDQADTPPPAGPTAGTVAP